MFTTEKPLISYTLLYWYNLWFDNQPLHIRIIITLGLLSLVGLMFYCPIPVVRGISGGVWTYWFLTRCLYIIGFTKP